MLSYAASVAGIWRLARRMMRLRWALVATTFYALNANLLFLSTTAMTEALFLALLIWSVVATTESIAALRANDAITARARMMLAGLLIFGQVFTRYDGWIIGAIIWLCFAWTLYSSDADLRRRMRPHFILFTIIVAAGPLLWFWYNAHFEHDWLDFLRGPYSAKQIERRTAPPGQHYRGWHNIGWAALFYTRTAQIDAAAWETGFALMAAALYGLWLSFKRRTAAAVRARAESFILLLWIPLPFYIYSVAYGSVPIFIPQLWPHAFYNARYGMELLPALAIYAALSAEQFETFLKSRTSKLRASRRSPLAARRHAPLRRQLHRHDVLHPAGASGSNPQLNHPRLARAQHCDRARDHPAERSRHDVAHQPRRRRSNRRPSSAHHGQRR